MSVGKMSARRIACERKEGKHFSTKLNSVRSTEQAGSKHLWYYWGTWVFMKHQTSPDYLKLIQLHKGLLFSTLLVS